MHRFLPFLLILLAAGPLLAEEHTWLGTASDRMSDAANWSGGSPENDPYAILRFPAEAARYDVVNDIPNLSFSELHFEGDRYTVAGSAMKIFDGAIFVEYAATISCDFEVGGTLTLWGGNAHPGLDLAGAIRGHGDVSARGGDVSFSGAASNTYRGVTVLFNTDLSLKKTGGAIAIPGDLLIEPWSSFASVQIFEPEQIADHATVTFDPLGGSLLLHADETVDTMDVGAQTSVGSDTESTLSVRTLKVHGSGAWIYGMTLNLLGDAVEVENDGSIYVSEDVILPPGGVTLRGTGVVEWTSESAVPVRIEGVHAILEMPNAAVTMTSGRFSGEAKTLEASGGTVHDVKVMHGRLGPGARVLLDSDTLKVNGTLELDHPSLVTLHYDGGDTTVVSNDSVQPVVGTFAGLPEGALLENRYRITYRGGNGYEVTITEVGNPQAHVEVSSDPGFFGEGATLRVTVSGTEGTPGGTITFYGLDGNELGTASVVDGTATFQLTPEQTQDEEVIVFVRYRGAGPYAGSGAFDYEVPLEERRPVLTSIEPSTGRRRTLVGVVIRGEHFTDRSRVYGVDLDAMERVSSTEIRAVFDLTAVDPGTLKIAVGDMQLSNTADFVVTNEPEPEAKLFFDEHAAWAKVTEGARAVWLASFEHATYARLSDLGGGYTRWAWTSPDRPRAVWSVVDFANGEWHVRGGHGASAEVVPFPAHTFSGGAFILRSPYDDFVPEQWRVLWVRPNVGAWVMELSDGTDGDGVRNGIVLGAVAGMLLLGDSPMPPAAFARGDVVIAMHAGARLAPNRVYAATLGEELDDVAPGVLQAAASDWTFSEDDGVARLPVIRTGGGSGTVTVDYAIRDANGSQDVYYRAVSGTLTYAPGELVQWIEVPLIDDAVRRGGGAFEVVLGVETAFAVTVQDDDPVVEVLLVGDDRQYALENDRAQVVMVELALAAPAPMPVTVEWQTAAMIPVRSGAVTFAPGETRKSVPITFHGDDVVSGNSVVRVELTSADGLLRTRFVEVLFFEDDLSSAEIDEVLVDEGAGVARVTVTLRRGSALPLAMTVATTPGTASQADFSAVVDTAGFTAGETRRVIEVPIVDDPLIEGDERFTVTLTGDLYIVGSPATVTIIDNDGVPQTRIVVDDITAAENAPAVFTVRLTAPSASTVTLNYITRDVTAWARYDYQDLAGQLTFAPGETTKSIAVPLVDDTVGEDDERFRLILYNPRGAPLADSRAMATITDDDHPAGRRRAVDH